MKIAIISPSLHMGGGEKFAVELANELANNKNNKVTLCIISKIHQEMILLQSIHKNVHLVSMQKDNGFDYKILFKLEKFLKINKFDLVHTHLRGLRYTSWSILRLKHIKYIHTFHTLVREEASSFLYQIFLKFCFTKLKVIPVAITLEVLKGIQDFFGKQHNTMILNGVAPLKKSDNFQKVYHEISSYKEDKNTKVFINVARVTKVKNQKLLIETFKNIQEKTILLIIGSLENEPIYAQECQKLAGGSSNIFFLGEKNNIGDYMYHADALCLSSIYEGLPLVILEAMSMGKPTLSTNVGGIPDVIINTQNGYLSQDLSLTSYHNTIIKFIKMPIINKEKIYLTFQKKYSMNICSNQYYNLYKEKLCPKK